MVAIEGEVESLKRGPMHPAAKIAIGKSLHEIQNSVTQRTTAAFEPALDYVVVKLPRFPFDKFPTADRTLGSQMKATGEVMAIDRTFEAAFQKAVRSLELGGKSLLWEASAWREADALPRVMELIDRPNDVQDCARYIIDDCAAGKVRHDVARREETDGDGQDRREDGRHQAHSDRFDQCSSDELIRFRTRLCQT